MKSLVSARGLGLCMGLMAKIIVFLQKTTERSRTEERERTFGLTTPVSSPQRRKCTTHCNSYSTISLSSVFDGKNEVVEKAKELVRTALEKASGEEVYIG